MVAGKLEAVKHTTPSATGAPGAGCAVLSQPSW